MILIEHIFYLESIYRILLDCFLDICFLAPRPPPITLHINDFQLKIKWKHLGCI